MSTFTNFSADELNDFSNSFISLGIFDFVFCGWFKDGGEDDVMGVSFEANFLLVSYSIPFMEKQTNKDCLIYIIGKNISEIIGPEPQS